MPEDIIKVIEFAREIGDFGNILVLGFIVFYLHEKGIIRFGKKRTEEEKIEDETPAWAAQFVQYVNHEQTDAIKEQARQLGHVASAMKEMSRSMAEHTKIDEGIVVKLNEWDKYGIPTRDGVKLKQV